MKKMDTKVDVTVRDSGVVVGSVVKIDKKKVIFRREFPAVEIGNEIASRIMGKVIGYAEIYDPKTRQFLSEDELTAKGAVIATVSYRAAVENMNKKSRIDKSANPFLGRVVKTSRFQILVNVEWESYINRRGHGQFTALDHRTNGVVNLEGCRAVGMTKAGNPTLNGVAFKVLTAPQYFVDGVEVDKSVLAPYLPDTTAAKETQADKHGIEVEFDPQYRTVRIDNTEYIRCFNIEYVPKDE
jgi:hypothetical protein